MRAARAIRTYGWSHRGGMQDEQGRLCIHGAIGMAVDGQLWPLSEENVATCQAMADYLREQGYSHIAGYGCAHWNNAYERTEQEMLDGIKGAAERAEAKQLQFTNV